MYIFYIKYIIYLTFIDFFNYDNYYFELEINANNCLTLKKIMYVNGKKKTVRYTKDVISKDIFKKVLGTEFKLIYKEINKNIEKVIKEEIDKCLLYYN